MKALILACSLTLVRFQLTFGAQDLSLLTFANFKGTRNWGYQQGPVCLQAMQLAIDDVQDKWLPDYRVKMELIEDEVRK